MRDVEASFWNELTKLVGGSGEGKWFESIRHMKKKTQTNKTFSEQDILRQKSEKKTFSASREIVSHSFPAIWFL